MKSLVVFLAIIFVSLSASSQQREVRVSGRVLDSASREALPGATVVLLLKKDASVLQHVLTSEDGYFNLNFNYSDTSAIKVMFIGYNVYETPLAIRDTTRKVALGNIMLGVKNIQLGGVEIVQQIPPIVVKKDTVEFNAGSFKTAPNAALEELLKKLPGLEVNPDGTFTFNGEKLTSILVDGKPFFTDDIQELAKILPAEIVDKVQMIDKKSQQAEDSGVQDGQRLKALNLVIKKDKKKGTFGSVGIAGGDEKRYNVNANLNLFSGDKQISLIGGTNNVNPNNFGNTSPGILKNTNYMVNYSDQLTKKLRVNGGYAYSKNFNQYGSESLKEYISVDSTKYNASSRVSENNRVNHRFSLNFEYEIDSTQTLKFKPSFSFGDGTGRSINNFQISSISNTIRNQGTDLTSNNNKTTQGAANLLYRKKFRQQGRIFTASVDWSGNNTEGTGLLENNRLLLDSTNQVKLDSTRQQNQNNSNSSNLSLRLTYVQPLKNDFFLESQYSYDTRATETDRGTYNWSKESEGYTDKVDSLSNNYHNLTNVHRAGLNIRKSLDKTDFTLGLKLQYNDLSSDNITKDTVSQQHTLNFSPLAMANFDLGNNRRLNITYNGNTMQPSLEQLQPVIDRSNSLYIQTGNPDLKPSFTHAMNLSYNAFNLDKQTGIFLGLSGTATMNKIVNRTTFDETGVQYSKPENVNGSFNLNGYVTNTFYFKKLKTRINARTNSAYSRNVSFLNGEKNFTNNLSVGENLSINLLIEEKLELNGSVNATWNQANYSLQPDNNQNYLSYGAQFTADVTLPWEIHLGSSVKYMATSGQARGFDQNNTLLNGYIYKNILKGNQGELKFSAYDILNQNTSVRRITNENYLEDVRTDVLKRYFMLSFVYYIRRFNGKSMTGSGPRVRRSAGATSIRSY